MIFIKTKNYPIFIASFDEINKTMKKTLINILLMILIFGAGLFVAKYISIFPAKQVTETSTDVLLERVRKVAKLVTVEGEFSEIYTHKDYYYFDVWPLQKKALLKVNAKVLVGFDLEKMTFQTYPEEKRLVISELPAPEILSIEPEITYYDMSQGTFNSFSEKELTSLNKKATDFIKDKADESEALKETAVKQGYEVLQLLEMIVRDAGWEVEYSKTNTIPEILKDSIKLKG